MNPFEFHCTVEMTPEDIAYGIPREHDLDVIKAIDTVHNDWGFTKKAYKYFKREMKSCPKGDLESAS